MGRSSDLSSQHVLIVGLSATLSNLHQFADWLHYVRDREVVVVEEYKRAVPLSFRIGTHQSKMRSISKTKSCTKRMGIRKPKPQPKHKRFHGKEKGHFKKSALRLVKQHISIFSYARSRSIHICILFFLGPKLNLLHLCSRVMFGNPYSPKEQQQVQDHIDRFVEQGAEQPSTNISNDCIAMELHFIMQACT